MDKVIVITGASAGIGAELARQAAGKGAKLVLAARRKPELEAVAARCGGEANGRPPRVSGADGARRPPAAWGLGAQVWKACVSLAMAPGRPRTRSLLPRSSYSWETTVVCSYTSPMRP